MNKLKTTTLSVIGAGLMAVSASGIAGAATTKLPQKDLRSERLSAAASVLNVSTDQVSAARKNHTVKDLVKKAGLTGSAFHKKVHDKIVSDFKAKGYSDEQIQAALAKHHHKHHAKHTVKK